MVPLALVASWGPCRVSAGGARRRVAALTRMAWKASWAQRGRRRPRPARAGHHYACHKLPGELGACPCRETAVLGQVRASLCSHSPMSGIRSHVKDIVYLQSSQTGVTGLVANAAVLAHLIYIQYYII